MNYIEENVVWKTYPEFPFIEANQFGVIRTKDRTVTRSNGRKMFVKGHVLKQCPNNKGYLLVVFSVNGKSVNRLVHRIVATCFLPNPNNLPQVNHKDNNPKNNVVRNLEWCTDQYNHDYRKNFGTSASELLGKPVIAVNPDTSDVFWFESQSEATRKLGIYQSSINKVIKGKLNKTGGYWFCYADNNAIEKVRAKFDDELANKVEMLMSEHL